jgi:raffinose/stachyose/melibiose transport system permease protein
VKPHAIRDRLSSLAFVIPALALFAVFVAYPIFYNFQASTLDWNGASEGIFVGFDNYVRLFQDEVFVKTLVNSALWIPLTIIPQAVVGLALALVLDQPLRGRNVYRAILFIPAILSPVVVGIVWSQILDPNRGTLAAIADQTGLDFLKFNYLGDPSTAIFTVMGVNIWMFTGFSMLFYLAGLQLIDHSLLEAAKIDGANFFQRTVHIVVPLLKTTHLTLLLLGIIGSLKTFELVYVMTTGGPYHATEMLPTYAFKQGFQTHEVGYASAISVALLIIAVGASLLMTRVFGSGFITGDKK